MRFAKQACSITFGQSSKASSFVFVAARERERRHRLQTTDEAPTALIRLPNGQHCRSPSSMSRIRNFTKEVGTQTSKNRVHQDVLDMTSNGKRGKGTT